MKPPVWSNARNKYGARTCSYGGSIYHSRREAAFAMELDALKAARSKKERVSEWKRQVKVSLDVNGKHVCNYYVDFKVTYADGREEWIEVKGFTTPEFKLKERLFRAIYPERELRVVR